MTACAATHSLASFCRVSCSSRPEPRPNRLVTSCPVSSDIWPPACLAPTRTAGRSGARSPTGATSTRLASVIRRSAGSFRISSPVAWDGCVRCSTTAMTRSATQRHCLTSSRSRLGFAPRVTASGEVWMPRTGGVEIALKGILSADRSIRLCTWAGRVPRTRSESRPTTCRRWDSRLGVFKAAQLIEMDEASAAFENFTAIDLETTDADTATAEIVELAAVRVRDGRHHGILRHTRQARACRSLPQPRTPTVCAQADVATASRFEDVWPAFRAFCGDDVIVAHNGYDFDFRILSRMARAIGDDVRSLHV